MASDERDRNFDKAIARHLRLAAASGPAAKRAADSSSRRDSCADPETLAAYHERSLLPEGMNSWKEHIVSCTQCQELLAHLEATEAIPLDAAEEVEVFAARNAQHAAARNIDPLPIPVDGADSARVPRWSHAARWRWLAPAGAIAAGLFAWIVIRENQPAVLPSSNEVKMAKTQESPAPSPPAENPVSPAERREQPASPKPPTVTDEITSATRRADGDLLKQHQVAAYAAKPAPAQPSAKEENKLSTDGERDAAADMFLNDKKADLDAKTVPGASQQQVEMQSQAANGQLQNQSKANSPSVAGPAPLSQVTTSKRMKASSAPPSTPAPAMGEASVGALAETVMVTSDPSRITAPGSNSVWHAGRVGLIEFSRDGGHSWSRQSSGALVDLLTGSAPSDKVCWIVGRAGTVLLTQDGGAHWKLISSPLKEDLGGIQATDALHATVWNALGTKSYATSDGGVTWERVSKP